ncbi:MAG: HDIG domain-containing protein [Chloroflexi bacterium]|nr:HDIG domain-containing protein [Chloroflexota bacterium]
MEIKGKTRKQLIQPGFLKTLILSVSALLAFFTLILPDIIKQSSLQIQIGDVTSQDILAPYSLSFESELLTERARKDAANSVQPIYLPTDPSIGRRQVEQLRTVLYFITTVRLDPFASIERKISDIQTVENLDLSEETIIRILQLNDARMAAIEVESTTVLEQIMRNTLREPDILTVKRNILALIDFSFPEEQAHIVVALVEPFIVPNSIFSAEQTDAAIEEARQSVNPVVRSFVSGETLVRLGQIISEIEWEALQRYGLIQSGSYWQNIIGASILTLVIALLIGLYYKKNPDSSISSVKSVLLVAVVFLLFLSIARFFVINRTILPYLYPLAAFGLTIAIIFTVEEAMLLSITLGLLTAYGLPNGFDLSVFYIVPTVLGILTLGKARRIGAFFFSGLTIGLAGIAIVLGYRLPDSATDWVGIATLSGAALIYGVASASLTLLLQYIFSQSLEITTSLQLLDTSRPDHPLLQLMLRNAPGSYQHSLQVANLAEQAAEAIGADGLLVRVGAIYHDCGKSLNPHFFIENQIQNESNPHDEIDPYLSARTIISHVTDGVNLARKHRLPERVIDFIKEHHGTMHTHYQYTKALQEAENRADVDKTLFTYPGPRPQSKETALLMLADGTEARTRAERPKDEGELEALIDIVFTFYSQNNQLDDTNLTLKDLQSIKESFFHTLKGAYHPRVKYPEIVKTDHQSIDNAKKK